MTRYLHTMIRVTDPEATIRFFNLIGLTETRRIENEKGRFTLIFLAADEDREAARARRAPEVELTWNWDPEPYSGGRNFGHMAFRVQDIYATCARLMAAGVLINRPLGMATWPLSAPRTAFRWSSCKRANTSPRPSPGRRCRTPATGENRTRAVHPPRSHP